MEMFVEGLAHVFEPYTFFLMVVGVTGGIIIGALPGMTASMGIILLMPLTYHLDPAAALLVMAGIFCGGMYGGSISAILICTPGGASASATVLDGYPMTLQGRAGKALGISCVSSFLGGLFSALCLLFIAPQLAKIALEFQPRDYFALSLFGLTIMASSSGKHMVKGLISGGLGLFLSTIGVDRVAGITRFSFGIPDLMGGVSRLPVLIGVFAVAQILENAENKGSANQVTVQELKGIWPTLGEMKQIAMAVTVGSLLGVFIGIVPGTGGAIACFLAYDVVKKLSKNGDKFGTGVIEGIAAPESSNNATTGGALIPMLTLGIPGDVVTAVMLGALLLIGVRPGPLLFQEQAQTVYTLLAGMLVIQFVMLILGLATCKYSPRLLSIPSTLLNPSIVLFCVLGSYTLANKLSDVLVTFIFGFVGYFMRKYKYPGAPMILGLILGPMAEDNLNRALLLSRGDWTTFITRPISGGFLLLSVLSLAFAFYNYYRGVKDERRQRLATKAEAAAEAAADGA